MSTDSKKAIPKTENSNEKAELNKPLFFTTAGLLIIITAFFVITPIKSEQVLSKISSFCVGPLGSIYLWGLLLAFFMICWLSFSKLGNIKFGSAEDKPEYSFLVWIGMIFTSSTGCSVLYWATVEWSYYFRGGGGSTPWGSAPGSWEAGEWGTAYSFFHNGLIGWAFMALVGVAVAYVIYIRKGRVFRISEVCRPVLGKYSDGFLGGAIDFIVIFAMASGIATSMGFAGPLVAGVSAAFFGVEYAGAYSYLVLLGWVIFSSLILLLNLEKGLSKVSNINIYLFYFFLFFVLFTGPTRFIIDQTTSALGKMTTYFFSMSLWTDAIGKTNFPQDWTMFFWAWWVLFAPVMGIFYAKISKGRTIKELALGVTVGGSIGIIMAYGVLGNFALHLDITGVYPASEMIFKGGAPADIIAKILMQLPLYKFILLVFMFLAFIYTATTIISVSYTFAATTTKSDASDGTIKEPAKWNRMFWVFLMMASGAALMSLGGLNALKAASIITAIPLIILCGIIAASLVKMLKEDGLLKKEVIIVNSEK